MLGSGFLFLCSPHPFGCCTDPEGAAESDLLTLVAALVRYKTRTGTFPSTKQGLDALVTRPTEGPQPRAWRRVIEQSDLTDPWGQPYGYQFVGGQTVRAIIWSLGADHRAGSDDDLVRLL